MERHCGCSCRPRCAEPANRVLWKKGQVVIDLALFQGDCSGAVRAQHSYGGHRPPLQSISAYFAYPCVEVVVAAASLCCAHAPKLKAPVKTAMIMITFRNFNSISPPFPASCCRLLGTETVRRNAFLDFVQHTAGALFSYNYGRPLLHERE